MKKHITIIIVLSLVIPQLNFAQTDKGFRVGLQFGNSANNLKLTGGMENANGRFKQKTFGAPAINLVARYDFDNHWMIESGVGLNAIGFSYSILENYSLVDFPKDKSSELKTIFAAFEVPLMAYYKFNPNCKNARWIVGAGAVPTLYEDKTSDQEFSFSNEGISTNRLNSQSVSSGGSSVVLRYSVGREKVFKNGSILQASALANIGLRKVASSTVSYNLDNENYSHTFSNNGSSVALRVAYLIRTSKNPAATPQR
jgi:hypothetical protein